MQSMDKYNVRPVEILNKCKWDNLHTKTFTLMKGQHSKRWSSNLLWWLIYLIDFVLDNLLKCFTLPSTQHAVCFKTKPPIKT